MMITGNRGDLNRQTQPRGTQKRGSYYSASGSRSKRRKRNIRDLIEEVIVAITESLNRRPKAAIAEGTRTGKPYTLQTLKQRGNPSDKVA